jgi:KUP system potassium uptake protein
VLLHLRALARPYVSEEEKFEVTRTSLPNCYRIMIRHGYNDIVVTEQLGEVVYSQLRHYLQTTPLRESTLVQASSAEDDSSTYSDRIKKRIDTLESAYASQTVYVSISFRLII